MDARKSAGIALGVMGSVLAAACDTDSAYVSGGDSPALSFSPSQVFVANNGADNAGTIDRRDGGYLLQGGFASGSNEGIVLDGAGNLMQAGDGAAGIALRTLCAVGERSAGFDAARDREIAGALTGLVNPKGVITIPAAGTAVVANFNAMNLQVFGAAAAGDVTPVATTPLPANPWDLVYDAAADRLFVALTNGSVAVFDAYVAGGYLGGSARTIVPAGDDGQQISVNLHGIAYDAQGDRLVVSDVGSAAVDDDGAIFVIADASTADGPVQPLRSISGPSTHLGNPVDIVLDGADLRVAEKARNALLAFADIFAGPSGDIAPALVTASTAPESLAVQLRGERMPAGVTDIVDAGVIEAIAVTSNVPEGVVPVVEAARHFVDRLQPDLAASLAEFDLPETLENVTFDRNGDAYLSYADAVAGPGVAIIGRLAALRDGDGFDATRDRRISGVSTGLIAPKGIAVAEASGLLLVADIGTDAASAGIAVFGACAAGDVTPLAVADTAGARPWDIDYDAATDRLFAAFTNGTVGVYDRFASRLGASGPDRLMTPVDAVGQKISVNLHGVHFDRASGVLIVSDVGSAADATDGQLFVLSSAAEASGNVVPSQVIGGPGSRLGNPVDLSYDGVNLYVAEKANNGVLRFDSLLSRGSGDVVPDATISRSAPESVALIPGYVGSGR
ncbi:MAG: hypothetical protein PHP86_18385 [Nevskiales bacterium]|nr:hypothetical protein [Nevskiales bacterium]